MVLDWIEKGQTVKGIGSTAQNREFGRSVSTSDDGGLIAVGNTTADDGKGRVNLYQYDATLEVWNPLSGNLGSIPNTSNDTNFSKIVEISGDGESVAVASDSNVYLYTNDGTNWTRIGIPVIDYDILGGITALSLPRIGNRLAVATLSGTYLNHIEVQAWGVASFTFDPRGPGSTDISISADGSTIVVAFDVLVSFNPVLVYEKRIGVYTVNDIGGVDGVTLIDTFNLTPNDNSGTRVDMNEMGDRFVVGIRGGDYEPINLIPDSVQVYELDDGTYRQVGQTITGGVEHSNGIEVEMSDCGDRIAALHYGGPTIIGPPYRLDPYISVYEFASGRWIQLSSRIPVNAQPYTGDVQRNLDMSGDGLTILAGEPAPQDGPVSAGQVRAFTCEASRADIVQTLTYWTNILDPTC
jgi:hypothetical protein